MTNSKGFTLVELAIVMIIIGLLIGGILKGTEMIENAKVSSTITQVRSYQAANLTFQDTYSATPGDMRNAETRVPGCAQGTTLCFNGGGDSMVGAVVLAGLGMENDIQAGSAALPYRETTQFWKHLVLADLITGVTTDADQTNPAWGETHPAAKIGGGFEVMYSGSAGDYGTGLVLRLQNPIALGQGQSMSLGQGANPISPLRAAQIDRKIDDGNPDTGSVTADFAATECDAGGEYNNTRRKNCIMFFDID